MQLRPCTQVAPCSWRRRRGVVRRAGWRLSGFSPNCRTPIRRQHPLRHEDHPRRGAHTLLLDLLLCESRARCAHSRGRCPLECTGQDRQENSDTNNPHKAGVRCTARGPLACPHCPSPSRFLPGCFLTMGEPVPPILRPQEHPVNHVAIPQAQALLPAGGTLREPEAVRQRLRADTEKWFEDMNHTLCTGSGDSAYWMHRTEYLTFRAASFAARSLLDVQEARVDDAAARRTAQPRLEQADHDFVAETRRLAKGTGDSGYWMGRVNTMNLAAASHACVAASLCDGAMAAVLRPTIEQALAQADRAFAGSGDANYWCRRASDQARTLEGNSGLATLHEKIVGQPALLADAPDASTPPLPAGTQALRENLERLGSGFTQQLDRLLFGHSLDATGWIMRADYIAFQSAAQAARLALLVADQRTDAPEQEAKGLQEIESAARDFRKSADSYATGCGDSAYWMKRDALLGVEVAKCLARVASACDAPMARAVRPRLEKMLTETTSLGFNGNGDAAYWSGRVKTLGNDLEMLLDDARIAVAGECAARSTEVATAPPAGTETSPAAETRRQAGIDLARHQVVPRRMEHLRADPRDRVGVAHHNHERPGPADQPPGAAGPRSRPRGSTARGTSCCPGSWAPWWP